MSAVTPHLIVAQRHTSMLQEAIQNFATSVDSKNFIQAGSDLGKIETLAMCVHDTARSMYDRLWDEQNRYEATKKS